MNQFIKLPDGTIINVAHVRKVRQPLPSYVYIDTGKTIDENQDNPSDYHDPDGKIYAWFAERAVEVA